MLLSNATINANYYNRCHTRSSQQALYHNKAAHLGKEELEGVQIGTKEQCCLLLQTVFH